MYFSENSRKTMIEVKKIPDAIPTE